MSHEIVVRLQYGNRLRNEAWEEYNDRRIAYYLGEVSTLFEEGLDENLVFNLDESHQIFDPDDRRAMAELGPNSLTMLH